MPSFGATVSKKQNPSSAIEVGLNRCVPDLLPSNLLTTKPSFGRSLAGKQDLTTGIEIGIHRGCGDGSNRPVTTSDCDCEGGNLPVIIGTGSGKLPIGFIELPLVSESDISFRFPSAFDPDLPIWVEFRGVAPPYTLEAPDILKLDEQIRDDVFIDGEVCAPFVAYFPLS